MVDISKPPPPLPSPVRLLLSLSALCSTLHPLTPPPQRSLKWHHSITSAWLKSVFKLLEIDSSRLPPSISEENIRSSASDQRDDWTTEEKVRMAGILVEASLAVDAQKESKEEVIRYTPVARALCHRTLELLGLPARDLLPEAENNLSSTLFSAYKAAQEDDAKQKVESTRAAHSQGWGGSLGRSLATGAGVIAGGVLIGVTGGLAAPAIAAVLAPLGIGGLLTAGAAPIVLGTFFGVGGGGLAGRRVRERWKGVEEFGFVEVGDGTKATKEEIADLQEAKKKLQKRQEEERIEAEKQEKVRADLAEKNGEKPNPFPEKRPVMLGRTSTMGEQIAMLNEKSEVSEPPSPIIETSEEGEGEKDRDEASEAEATKASEEERDILSERLLKLSLEAGTRTSISSQSGSTRASMDSPRPSLEQGTDENAMAQAKKPPSLTATIVVPGLLTVSRTEAITAWRAVCSSKTQAGDVPIPYSPREKQIEAGENEATPLPEAPVQGKLAFKDGRDVYLLQFETETMLSTGRAVNFTVSGFIKGKVKGRVKKEIIKRVALSAAFAAVSLPRRVYGLAGMTLDNTWQHSQDRARKAGQLLGEVLEKRVQGERPVVLIGSSLGALTVLHALLYLSSLPPPPSSQSPVPAFVESAYLISLPSAPSADEWAKCRAVVARRFVNGWSSADWVLAGVVRVHEVISRAATFQSGVSVAGLSPVNQPGIEDVDLSNVLKGHMELQTKIGEVMQVIDVDA